MDGNDFGAVRAGLFVSLLEARNGGLARLGQPREGAHPLEEGRRVNLDAIQQGLFAEEHSQRHDGDAKFLDDSRGKVAGGVGDDVDGQLIMRLCGRV